MTCNHGWCHYIITRDVLEEQRPNLMLYNASSIPGYPDHVWLRIKWGDGLQDSRLEAELEEYLDSHPDVIPLGLPWEQLPVAVVPFLAAFQELPTDASSRLAAQTPPVPAVSETDTVGRALKKLRIRT